MSIFNLYNTMDNYGQGDVPHDDDSSVSLASFRQISDAPPSPSTWPLRRSVRASPVPSPRSSARLQSGTVNIEDLKIQAAAHTNNHGRELAVEVTGAHFQYGKSKKAVHALRGIDLTVPEAGIYGLLGPSGCGKTSLLRCMVGRLEPTTGSIRIFGKKPGEPGAQVPGRAIGFMPQEIALFPDFSISETLKYFARLYRLKDKHIKKRAAFLLGFLDLPDKHRMVGNLSGGQKRRVSLAASLIHSPPLVILDEPTVGVDPLLRQSIWNHLVELTKTERLTVIITTHYIEEARQAHTVGLMRFGRILIEANPDFLLQRFNSPTLEEVFLKLCEMDTNGIVVTDYDADRKLAKDNSMLSLKQKKPDICDGLINVKFADADSRSCASSGVGESPTPEECFKNQLDYDSPIKVTSDKLFDVSLEDQNATRTARKFDNKGCFMDSYHRTGALFWKNCTRLRRNMAVLMFQFLLPSIEVILFCACIGQNPSNIKVAVVNLEDPPMYSAWFLEQISNETINQQHYNNHDEAIQAVKYGDCWAALVIGKNFSNAMQMRVMLAGGVDNETVEQSIVHLYPDSTNQIISLQVYQTITYSFLDFGKNMLQMMGQSTSMLEIPVKLEKPVYGDKEPTFTEFMAPGVILSIAFLAAVALTALAFVMERKEGLLERTMIAGVSSGEFMLSHILTQLLVLVVQVALLLIFTFIVFEIPSRGPFFWVILLTMLQGTCGMAFGLMISSLCKEENSATMLALGSFYPNLLLSGTVWPTQAMPVYVRYFSYLLPQTIPIESMRYILSRGWGIEYFEVFLGFLVTSVWITFFLIMAVIIFRIRK